MFGRQFGQPGGDADGVVGFSGWGLSGCGRKIGLRSQQRNHPRGFQHGTTVDLHSSTSRTTEFAAGTFAAIITLSFRSGHQTSALGQPATLLRPTESERAAYTTSPITMGPHYVICSSAARWH